MPGFYDVNTTNTNILLPGSRTPGETRTLWLTDEEIASYTSKGVTLTVNNTVNSAVDMKGVTRYRDLDQNDNIPSGIETISTDAAFTIDTSRKGTIIFAGNGTASAANRAVTLSTTGMQANSKYRVVYKAGITGGFNISLGALKNLTAGQWADIQFDGSAFVLTAFGSL